MSKPAPRKPMQAPYRLNETSHKAVLAALAKGVHLETVASLCGISRDTLWRWLSDGERNPEGPCGQLYRDAQKVMAETEAALLETIRNQAPADWKAAAWILRHRHPKRWNQPTVEVREDEPQETDLDGYTNEELLELHAAIEATKRKLAKRKLQASEGKPTH